MVNPVHPQPATNQPTTSTEQTARSPSIPEGLSSSDMQALQRTSGRDSRRQSGSGGQGQATGTSARTGNGSTQSAPSRRTGAQGQSGSRRGALQGRRHTDRSLTRPTDDFDVRPIVAGASVLVSKDGKVLFNLRGPVAGAIAERLSSTLPKSERPTVWLDDVFGHVSLAAIREHLNVAVRPEDGNAIAVRRDGTMVLYQDRREATRDELIIAERAFSQGQGRGNGQQPAAATQMQSAMHRMAETVRNQAAAMKPARTDRTASLNGKPVDTGDQRGRPG